MKLVKTEKLDQITFLSSLYNKLTKAANPFHYILKNLPRFSKYFSKPWILYFCNTVGHRIIDFKILLDN